MVKRIVLTLVVLSGAVTVPRPAMAGCTTARADCYTAAVKVCVPPADGRRCSPAPE
jgi:hypothetical protein